MELTIAREASDVAGDAVVAWIKTMCVPTPAMVVWAGGYVVVMVAIALRQFSKRPL